MASELHDILNTIRKDLHSEIDRVFTNGNHAIYIYLTKKLEETHSQQLKDIYARLDSLQAASVTNKVADSRIPEVYFTDVNITEAIQNIEEDGTVHEEDDVLTVHDETSISEVIDVVEEEEVQADLVENVVEEEEEAIEVVEEEDDQTELEEEVVEEEEEDQAELEKDQVELEDEVVEDQAELEEEAIEEEEDNSESLNEIEVDGVSYYYDSNGDVWELNEDNEPIGIIGKYNETDGEFELFNQAEPEGLQCEEFTYKGRTYLKDADNNVYTTEGEETGYKFLNNKLVKVA
jgi:hypothetical protein